MKHLVDTHAHLLKDFYKDLDLTKIVNHAIENNVKRIINVSTDLMNINDVINSTKIFSEVFAAIGIHPQNASDLKISIEEAIKKHLRIKKVVAIGEIGFDFYRKKGSEIERIQQIVFHDQMKLAIEYSLPVIIHSRNATHVTMKELAKYPDVKKVVHCFSENQEIMNNYLKIPNTYISFTGIVTFKNAKDVQAAFLNCPLNRIMFETDCPFLAPTPYRGKINKPGYTHNIADFCAKLRNIEFNELQEIVTSNTYKFFNKLY